MATRSRSHALRAAQEITARQREVLGLIALGLTNKEMAHSLGISERGAAAHVSRLLARFSVPNRAGLIARTFSNAVASRASDPTTGKSETVPVPPGVELELEAYRESTFQIGVTVGSENLLVYVNEAGKKLFGIAPEDAAGARFASRRASPGTNAFRDESARAFKTGRATTIERRRARWLRDDGTWSSGRFSCVLQPLREATGRVFGLLWICMPGLEAGRSPAVRGINAAAHESAKPRKDGSESMAVKLNETAFEHARSLVDEGEVVVDERDDWSEHQPSTADENRFIEKHGIREYAKWHLGVDDEEGEENKGRYKFPYGDFKKVHRCAILAAESRAGQYKYADIERAAAHLHGMIERREVRA